MDLATAQRGYAHQLRVDTKTSLAQFTPVTKPPSKLAEPQVEYSPKPPSRDEREPIPEFDLSQLERNLSLTPEERLVDHQHALELVLELEAAGKALRDKP